MRNKTHLWKRSLAALLCFIMVLGMIPALDFVPAALAVEETENGDTTGGENTSSTGPQGNYITLPITVRDFAADGMLFEYNEVDRNTFVNNVAVTTSSGSTYDIANRDENGMIADGLAEPNPITYTDRLTYNQTTTDIFGTREPYKASYNPTYWDLKSTNGWPTYVDGVADTNYTGIRIYPAGAELFEEADHTQVNGSNWYCIIVDANGNILKVLDRTADKKNIDTIMNETTGAAYSVWAWRDPSNLPYYNLLAKVTEENRGEYYFSFTPSSTAGGTIDVYLSQKTYLENIPYWQMSGTYGHEGIYYYDNNIANYLTEEQFSYFGSWHLIVFDTYYGDGRIIQVVPSGTSKVDTLKSCIEDQYAAYNRYILVWDSNDNRDNYNFVAAITTDNYSEYSINIPECTVGNPLFIERTVSMHEANTRGFGLLFTKDNDKWHNLYDDGDGVDEAGEFFINGSLLEDNDPTSTSGYNQSPYKTVYIWDEEETAENPKTEHVSQDLYYGTIRTGLVGQKLDEKTKKPVYTQATVDYLANYMSLVMPQVAYENGIYYSNHVMGAKMFNATGTYVGLGHEDAEKDLAQVLRDKVYAANTAGAAGYKLGTYTDAQAKYNAGGLRTYMDVETWYDAAYFLLHNTWSDSTLDVDEEQNDGYGMPMSNYHSMHLMETTNADGQTCYVFNAKYNNTVYDSNKGEMYNAPFASGETPDNKKYPVAVAKGKTTDYIMSGIELPALRFDPLGPASTGGWQGYGKEGSGNTYGELTGAKVTQDWSEYYDETNYHMSLEGHAQFVYQYDANQYFTFTGDDDVYLYINGFRVLDIGGAHGIAKVRININDVAKKIGLQNGGTYTFDFFYMERHGTAANFGIETNIQIADASMQTAKQGFQNGVNTGYGGPVNANNHVGYTFELENNGQAHLSNLTFNDPNLDVYFGYDKIRPYPEGQDAANDRYPYTIEEDLYLIHYNSAGEIEEYIKPNTGLTAETLQARLIAGLAPGEKIGIYGIKYKIPDNQWVDTDKDGVKEFINTVYTTATDRSKTLQGVADWKVVQMQHPYEAFRVYDWVHKIVSNDPADAENLIWKTPTENGIPVANGVTVSKDDLITKYLIDNKNITSLTPQERAAIQITLCTAAGNEDEYFLQGSKASVNSATGDITYTSDTVGKDTVFFKFKDVYQNGDKKAVYDSLVFSYEVYTYGAVDNVYVLDYGLSVELAGETFGFQNNDHLKLNENNRTMVATVTGMLGQVEDKDEDGNTIEDENGNAVLVWDIVPSNDGTYGTFTFTTVDAEGNTIPASLKYTPDEIINNTDEVYAKFRIMEEEAIEDGEEPSIYNSVEMVQRITTAPASVVYYEENFPGITYVDSDENKWVHYETVDEDGNPLAGTEQSADQDSNYGSDPNYGAEADDETNLDDYTGGDKVGDWGDGTPVNPPAEEDITEEWDAPVINTTKLNLDTNDYEALQTSVVDFLNQYLGLTGEASNGSINVLEVKETAEVMYFDFAGTGFEIISRTTANQYAVVSANVYRLDAEGNVAQVQKKYKGELVFDEEGNPVMVDDLVRSVPVITESKGGDLYQVPIISVMDLEHGSYRVVLKATGKTTSSGETINKTRVLYIDGIRIYGPLESGDALEYYNPEEYQAEFYKIKELIFKGRMIYGDFTDNDTGGMIMNTGGIMIEHTEGEDYVLSEVSSPDDYMDFGPNNEIYLDGNASAGTIAFMLRPIANYPETARTIEIGAHRKSDYIWEDQEPVYLVYGSDADSVYSAEEGDSNFHTVASGTEMYYTIDVKNLIYDEVNDFYLVMIGTNGSEGGSAPLCLTNLKIAGYEISFAEAAVRSADADGDVKNTPAMAETYKLLKYRMAQVEEDPEVVEVPVNENLTINSAVLKATKVGSGKTATLSVKAGAEAERIVITDSEGNIVEFSRNTRKVSGGVATFQLMWTVTGTRGQELTYTIRVYDVNNLASVNVETVTVTIK